MLSLSMLKARWSGLLGTFVALMLGVTMLTMTTLLLSSAQPQVPQRFASTQIVVTTPEPQAEPDSFPQPRRFAPADADDLIARLSAIPGVVEAIADRPFYAQPVIDGTPAQDTTGNVWPLAPSLAEGSAPTGPGEVAVSKSLGRKPGDRVTILTAPGPRDYTVSGTVDGPGSYFTTSPAGVLAIALRTAGELDLARVESAVNGRGRVLAGDGRAALEPVADARTRWIGMQVLTAMGALSAFAAVFLVASTFSFSVLQRRRELGLLRAIGATPRQLRRMMLAEALGLGVVAAAAGVGLGALGTPILGDLLVEAGFEPPTFVIGYAVLPMAGAFAGGLVVALAGVWAASRRAAGVGPLEALRVAEAERRPMTRGRWICGAASLALGAVSAVATAGADALSMPTYAGFSAMALIAGLSLLAPALLPPLARLLLAPLRHGPVGMLVRQSAATAARRTASTAAPVLLSVAFTVLVAGMVQTTTEAYALRRAATLPADAALMPDGTPGLSDAAVRSVDGIAFASTTVYHGEAPFTAMGLSNHEGDGMRVVAWVAAQRGWVAGQTVELTVADGQTERVRIDSVGEDMPAPAQIVVARDWVLRTDANALTLAVLMRAAGPGTPAGGPGTPAGGPGAPIGELVRVPGGKVVDAQTYAAQADAAEDRLVWLFTLILIGMAAGFTVIAVANTLLMDSLARLRELFVLRRAGATVRQVLRVVATETTVVVAFGALLGGIVSMAALLAIRSGLSEQIGRPVALVVPWTTAGVAIGACLIAGLMASVLPIAGALRANKAGN